MANKYCIVYCIVTKKYPGRLQKRTREFSKTALEFENCKQQLFTLTMCFELKLPRPRFNTRSQLGQFLQNLVTINFRDGSSVSSIREKNYRIASMFIITYRGT